MTLVEIVANSGAMATKVADHEPILLTYKQLAAKIQFSYGRVRRLASIGFLDERGLTYVMGIAARRLGHLPAHRRGAAAHAQARHQKGIRKTNGR